MRTAGLSRPDARLLAESVRFGSRAWLGSASLFLNARLDQILLGLLASDVALGLYAVAVNGAEILLFLPTRSPRRCSLRWPARRGCRRSSAPCGRSGGGDPDAEHDRGRRRLGWIAIPLAFGSDFADSVEPFMWLLPGALGYTALSIFSNSLLASHAPGLSSLGSAAALGVSVVLDLLLIPPFGASGAAAAASAAFLAGGAAGAAAYRRQTGYRWSELVPGGADVAFLRVVAERALRRDRSGS